MPTGPLQTRDRVAAAAPLAACRVFFPLAALMAMAGVLLPLMTDSPLPPGWHGHEMLFGFGGAIFAGYSLTAAPGWSGRARPGRSVVLTLVALWLAARAGAVSQGPGLALAGPLFFLGLSAALAREARAARSRKGAVQAGLALALGLAEAAAIAGFSGPLPGLGVIGLLISGVGGRIVAGFTAARQEPSTPPPANRAGAVACTALILAALALGIGRPGLAAAALLVAGLAEAARLALWIGAATRSDALLGMLHAAWVWVAVAYVLPALDLAGAGPLPQPVALHALTAGGMGGLALAMMARATARRGPDRLQARPAMCLAAACVWGATALRLGAGIWPGLLIPAALIWSAGWGLVVLSLIADLRRPVPHPVFSGPRRLSPLPRPWPMQGPATA